MKRVYVTENGYFDEYGSFQVLSVIGVGSCLKDVVSFLIHSGCYRHHFHKDRISLVLYYKYSFSNRGYRITCIDAF